MHPLFTMAIQNLMFFTHLAVDITTAKNVLRHLPQEKRQSVQGIGHARYVSHKLFWSLRSWGRPQSSNLLEKIAGKLNKSQRQT